MVNVSFWESFFGITMDPSDRFVRQFEKLFPVQSQLWGKKDAVWIDTNDAWKLFLEIPELRAVISKRSNMMASAKPCLVDKNGNEVENHWFNEIIKKPNGTQSWSDFIFSIGVQDGLYSNTFIYSPERSFKIRNLMVPLPSNKIKINTTGKKLKQMDVDGLIQNYVFYYDDGEVETLEPIDVIYITTSDGMNLINPISRIESLKFPLSNIRAQYHKRNVLLENIGAIGILTAKNSDIGGSIPMTPEDKKQIQRDWFKRSKDELIITESDVTWQPMSFPTKDLMLFEELTADKIALIDAFGLSIHLFSSEKGTTFTNVRDSIRMCYQDTIIPETQQIYDAISQQCGLTDDGLRLIAEFNHLPVLQTDELQSAQTMKTRAEAVEKIIPFGVLSPDEIRLLLEIEKNT
jgi:HK97 family phage portal protein